MTELYKINPREIRAADPAIPSARFKATRNRITWTCETCGHPITRRQQGWASSYAYAGIGCREDGKDPTIRGVYLPAGRWHFQHAACLTQDEQDTYATYNIGLERMDTPAKLKNWWHHLRQKRWYSATNFPEIVVAVGDALGDPGLSSFDEVYA